MNCPKNKWKWWIFSGENPCQYEITRVKDSELYYNRYIIIETCKICDCDKEYSVSEKDLIRMDLEKPPYSYINWGYDPRESTTPER